VGAAGADGKERLAAAREQDRFLTHMPGKQATVDEVGDGDTGGQVGAG
jgi:hypothetical protein